MTLPGPQGDHWFSADLRGGPGLPAATLAVPLAARLPLASATAVITVSGAAYTAGAHRLRVQIGAQSAEASWAGIGSWTEVVTLTNTSGLSLTLTVVAGATPDGLEISGVAWEQGAQLDFGGRSAPFDTVGGTWRYALSNMAADATLYDVTAPLTPTVVTLPAGTAAQLQDGPAPRRYRLARSADLATPAVAAHAPVTLGTPTGAAALYLAPAALHAALAPLVAQRQAQGYTVQVVDVQGIYDLWSFGAVSPNAIRQFLRYLWATAQPRPAAVTLVGDGTADPRDYAGYHNRTLIPPYLAMVDPWIGETACDACYAQLDGADPLADPWPDLALGRLPVNTAGELTSLVGKLVSYERNQSWIGQHPTVAYLADNARDADGNADPAGDFAAYADSGAALQPSTATVARLYYDPWSASAAQPWREPDAGRAHQRALDLLNQGAALVNYVGHSNTWQWAVTDFTADPAYLLGLYDPDGLQNRGHPSVLLEMTCLTAAFQTVAPLPTTIDERLLLHPSGGMVAIWGPTGQSIASGHDALQRGFYAALWHSRSRPIIGALTAAGVDELLRTGSNSEAQTAWAFVLLGDPLMPLQVNPAQRWVYLPVARR